MSRLVLSLLLVAACGKGAPESKEVEAAAPIAVTTVAVASASVPRDLDLTGSLIADEKADIAAEVAGAVKEAPADRGDILAKGAPILVIDGAMAGYQAQEAKAAAAAADVQAKLAKDECARAAALFEAGGQSTAELQRAQAQCDATSSQASAAAARAGQASTNYAHTTIRAPFAGVLMERLVSPGDYVGPGRIVARIVASDPLRLQLSVPERAAASVTPGAAVRFTVTGLDGEFTANLDRISPALRERTRDLIVEATIPNGDGRLKPGGFALAHLSLPEGPGLVVPASALRKRGDTTRIFIDVGGRAEERVVETGATIGDLVEIRDGVVEGEPVIAPLTDAITDGAALQTTTGS